MAEIDFRKYISDLGFSDRVSEGGWIARCDSRSDLSFGKNTVVLFPEEIKPNENYCLDRELPEPKRGLHTICATFHQIGIRSYYCSPVIQNADVLNAVKWHAVEMGIPVEAEYMEFPQCLEGFAPRVRNYNFLRYNKDVSAIPENAIPIEFTKEVLRVVFQNSFFAEISDIDGLVWGREKTYPLEIKEKTRVSEDAKMGDWFGIDVGPFVKLAYYAAKKGNLHSLFIVREIDNVEDRNLVAWKYITFDRLAQFASWVPQPGGRSMTGGGSSTIKIPVEQFDVLDKKALEKL